MHSRRIRIHDLELHYLEHGEGPPVVLLHGWPTHAQLYRHALPVIEGRRAIALDLPGFGDSAKPLDASYSFRFYDRILTGFLDALELDRTGLVVHDLGGPIGLHWAIHNQQRVSDLVLLNTLVFPEMSPAVKIFVGSSMIPGVRRVLSSPWGIAKAMRFGVQDKSRIDEEVARIYTAPFADRDARKALLKTAHGLHPKGFDTLAERVGELTMPMHLIYGEDDRILPHVARTMARVKEACPHATLQSIANCGHFLQEDRPEEVARLLAEALSR